MSDPNAMPPVEPNRGPVAGAPLSASDDKLYATLSVFGNIILLIPALIIYLVFKDRGALVRQQSKEALNWTINVTGIVIAANIVSAILSNIPFVGGILSLLLSLVVFAVLIVNLILSIIGGVRVNGGGTYVYPFNIRWIK